MTKKLLLLSTLFLFCAGFAFNNVHAQCTPDTTMSTSGSSPSVLSDGCRGQAYSETIFVAFPKDSTISGFTVNLDSASISSANFPAGLTYNVCNVPNCKWYANSTPQNANHIFGCIQIGGAPATTFSGNAIIDFQLCFTVFGSPTCVTYSDTFAIDIFDAPVAGYSHSITGMMANFTDLTTGSVTGWNWDFGDGNTSTMQNPSHTYATAGLYNVCLITDNGNCFDTICQNVTTGCPNPSVAWSEAVNMLTVTFTDGTPGSPTSWAWDFGDGNTSIMQNPMHTYAAAGTYTVCLTVTDSCGSDSLCNTVMPCMLPASSFVYTTSGTSVTFTDSSAGATSWMWDFGDGNSDTTQSPMHIYAGDSTYNVCLISTNSCGSDTSCQSLILASIPEYFPMSNFALYPNPANSSITLSAKTAISGAVVVSIFDVLGRERFQTKVAIVGNRFDTSIDVHEFDQGVYFITTEFEGQQFTQKFVKN